MPFKGEAFVDPEVNLKYGWKTTITGAALLVAGIVSLVYCSKKGKTTQKKINLIDKIKNKLLISQCELVDVLQIHTKIKQKAEQLAQSENQEALLQEIIKNNDTIITLENKNNLLSLGIGLGLVASIGGIILTGKGIIDIKTAKGLIKQIARINNFPNPSTGKSTTENQPFKEFIEKHDLAKQAFMIKSDTIKELITDHNSLKTKIEKLQEIFISECNTWFHGKYKKDIDKAEKFHKTNLTSNPKVHPKIKQQFLEIKKITTMNSPKSSVSLEKLKEQQSKLNNEVYKLEVKINQLKKNITSTPLKTNNHILQYISNEIIIFKNKIQLLINKKENIILENYKNLNKITNFCKANENLEKDMLKVACLKEDQEHIKQIENMTQNMLSLNEVLKIQEGMKFDQIKFNVQNYDNHLSFLQKLKKDIGSNKKTIKN